MPCTIPLTRGRVALVDDADYPTLSQFKWYCTSDSYAARTVRKKTIAMHRLITGAQPGQLVDHRDGNRLNNTRANLRLVTPGQNQHNRRRNHNSTSGYKGVTRFRDRWQARIRVDGRRIHLGYYDNPRQAASIYDAAARHFFGHYAHTNAPKDVVTQPKDEAQLRAVLRGDRPKRPSKPRQPAIPQARSQFRGVYWERGRWRACIVVEGRKRHLGYFRDERRAAQAYDDAARELRGANARLNFPDDT